jgi:hypothetical protein
MEHDGQHTLSEIQRELRLLWRREGSALELRSHVMRATQTELVLG